MRAEGLPGQCPSCGGELRVVVLRCGSCGTEVTGDYALPELSRLEKPYQELYRLFIRHRGNVRKVGDAMGLSYPTIRQRIDEMFRRIEHPPQPRRQASAVLARLRAGEITAAEAERQLRGVSGG